MSAILEALKRSERARGEDKTSGGEPPPPAGRRRRWWLLALLVVIAGLMGAALAYQQNWMGVRDIAQRWLPLGTDKPAAKTRQKATPDRQARQNKPATDAPANPANQRKQNRQAANGNKPPDQPADTGAAKKEKSTAAGQKAGGEEKLKPWQIRLAKARAEKEARQEKWQNQPQQANAANPDDQDTKRNQASATPTPESSPGNGVASGDLKPAVTAAGGNSPSAERPATNADDIPDRTSPDQPPNPPVNPGRDTNPSPSSSGSEYPLRHELPLRIRTQMPVITMNMHRYHIASEERFVLINMRRMTEGDITEEQYEIVAIVEEGVVLKYSGHEFLLPVE